MLCYLLWALVMELVPPSGRGHVQEPGRLNWLPLERGGKQPQENGINRVGVEGWGGGVEMNKQGRKSQWGGNSEVRHTVEIEKKF